MTGLFDQPRPGQRCPTCNHIVPVPPPLRAGKYHPETSHDAAMLAEKARTTRQAAAIELLGKAGGDGLTDDEIDCITKWGHQCTTPIMWSLRKSRLIGWAYDEFGKVRTRKTRKGHAARVNVLGDYAVFAAGEGG